MPPLSWKDSDSYKRYSSFKRRPANIPLWQKNAQGKYLVENGELMCRLEVDGAICSTATCYSSRLALTKHLTDHHPEIVTIPTQWAKNRSAPGTTRDIYLIRFYTDLVAKMQAASVDGIVQDAAEARVQTANRDYIPDNADADDDSNTEHEDNIDPLPTVPKSASHAAIQSYGISELKFSNTIMNPQPPKPSNSPPSRLPASYRKVDLYADWDPEVLKKAREENAKIIRKPTSESNGTSLADRIREAQNKAKERQG